MHWQEVQFALPLRARVSFQDNAFVAAYCGPSQRASAASLHSHSPQHLAKVLVDAYPLRYTT